MKKNKYIKTFRVDEEHWTLLVEESKRESRSIVDMVRRILELRYRCASCLHSGTHTTEPPCVTCRRGLGDKLNWRART